MCTLKCRGVSAAFGRSYIDVLARIHVVQRRSLAPSPTRERRGARHWEGAAFHALCTHPRFAPLTRVLSAYPLSPHPAASSACFVVSSCISAIHALPAVHHNAALPPVSPHPLVYACDTLAQPHRRLLPTHIHTHTHTHIRTLCANGFPSSPQKCGGCTLLVYIARLCADTAKRAPSQVRSNSLPPPSPPITHVRPYQHAYTSSFSSFS